MIREAIALCVGAPFLIFLILQMAREWRERGPLIERMLLAGMTLLIWTMTVAVALHFQVSILRAIGVI